MLTKATMLTVLLGLMLASMACAPQAAPAPTPTQAPAAASTKAAEPTKPPATTPTVPVAPTPTPRPATLKFGSIQSLADAGVYVAMDKGYFKELGISVELNSFQTTAEMIGPLGTGQLDGLIMAPSVPLLAAADRGVEMKIVGGSAQYRPKMETSWLVLRKDLADSGQVKTVADLKGMKVGIPSLGSMGDMMWQTAIKEAGLKPGDADIVVMPFPSQAAALGNKAIAAGYSVEPFTTRGVQEGILVKWIPVNQFFGGKGQAGMIVFGSVLSNDQDLARRWMIAYLKGARDYMRAFTTKEGRDEAVSSLVKYSTVKDPKLYDAMEMSYVDPNGELDGKSMDVQYKWFVDKGLYTGKKSFNDLVDLSHLEYALQKLGKQ